MKSLLALILFFIAFSPTVHTQVLLYQWAFNNSSDTLSNSATSYAWIPGTGNLTLQNVSGDVSGLTGTDGINPLAYFTNSNVGPVIPGDGSLGAFVANGQGYLSAPTAIAIATNLNLGNQFEFTVTFWVQLGATTSGQFPRVVQFYQTPGYDVGGKDLGNHSGVGSSFNGWSGAIAASFQNGIANATQAQQNQVSVAGNPALAPGFSADGLTWYFEAITYDGTATASNFTTWVGLTNVSVQPFVQTANYGEINFTTNATVMIGGNDVSATPRGLSSGAIADVRFYNGALTSNQVDSVRVGISCADCLPPPPPDPPTITQPQSGNTYVGGSRTFSLVVTGGYPEVFTYLWRSNGVPIVGDINSSLTLSNVQLSANGASFVCSVTNPVGGTNSVAATLTVLPSPPTNTYAGAINALNPFSFWLINEPSNSSPVTVYDYVGGRDGAALDPTNMLFVSGPSSPTYSGFPANNAAIEEIATFPYLPSRLNLGGPGTFVNSGMTLCGWINLPETANAWGDIFYNQVSDVGSVFALGFDGNGSNEVSYFWGDTTPAIFDATPTGLNVPTNEWTFVALVVSTNSTPDTNVTIYMGAPGLGLVSATDSTAATGDLIGSGSDNNIIACGRSTASVAYEGFSLFGAITAQFSSVAVFYSSLSPSTITHLYQVGVGVSLAAVPDPNVPGNLLLKWNFGRLQQAGDVDGPYTDVAGPPVSPYSVPMTGQKQFYRIRN